MGYPMTFMRFVRRNGLEHGGYDGYTDPESARHTPHPRIHVIGPTIFGGTAEQREKQAESARRNPPTGEEYLRLLQANTSATYMLLGDLRRLQHDALDEGYILKHIASTTGVAEDEVAAVLDAFLQL